MARKPYPTDVTDEEWAFVAPYLSLMREDAPQREHSLREVFDALRYVVRAGEAWDDAARSAAVGHCVSADAAVDEGRRVRDDDARSARASAVVGGPRPQTIGGDLRQPDTTKHAGKRRPGLLCGRQAEEGKES